MISLTRNSTGSHTTTIEPAGKAMHSWTHTLLPQSSIPSSSNQYSPKYNPSKETKSDSKRSSRKTPFTSSIIGEQSLPPRELIKKEEQPNKRCHKVSNTRAASIIQPRGEQRQTSNRGDQPKGHDPQRHKAKHNKFEDNEKKTFKKNKNKTKSGRRKQWKNKGVSVRKTKKEIKPCKTLHQDKKKGTREKQAQPTSLSPPHQTTDGKRFLQTTVTFGS